MSPILDLFITLLSMGAVGYRALLQQREVHITHVELEVGVLAHYRDVRQCSRRLVCYILLFRMR